MTSLRIFIFIEILGIIQSEVLYYLDDKSTILEKNLNEDLLDFKRPFKFIIHGWTQDANVTQFVQMAEAYVKRGGFNVIRVDYSKISKMEYVRATFRLSDLGKEIGSFIAHLHKNHSVALSNIHLVGHSMGSQVAGYTGRSVKNLTGSKIGRITGLDPARPGFEGIFTPETNKLTANDAVMVDIIHTDAGGYGYMDPHGTVDFYPNSGLRLQPSCKSNPTTTFDFIPGFNGILNAFIFPSDNFCSHSQSVIFYTESIHSKIEATKCDSWNNYIKGQCDENEKVWFGESLQITAKGVYYTKLDVDSFLLNEVQVQ